MGLREGEVRGCGGEGDEKDESLVGIFSNSSFE